MANKQQIKARHNAKHCAQREVGRERDIQKKSKRKREKEWEGDSERELST